MNYLEKKQDLFSVPEEYYLAHCISADFALGAGIAIAFDKKFDMRMKLKKAYPNFLYAYNKANMQGACLLIDNVLNLVTKAKYYQKPTYATLYIALCHMRDTCQINNIKQIAMPAIGCGLDRLDWAKVSDMIKTIFKSTDIEILVCMC